MVFITSCYKEQINPTPPVTETDIFQLKEVSVTDAQIIHFTLKTQGKYIFTLTDFQTNQVVSKERFYGVAGDNIKKIYTKSLSQKTLYLYLTDEANNQIGKTTLIIN